MMPTSDETASKSERSQNTEGSQGTSDEIKEAEGLMTDMQRYYSNERERTRKIDSIKREILVKALEKEPQLKEAILNRPLYHMAPGGVQVSFKNDLVKEIRSSQEQLVNNPQNIDSFASLRGLDVPTAMMLVESLAKEGVLVHMSGTSFSSYPEVFSQYTDEWADRYHGRNGKGYLCDLELSIGILIPESLREKLERKSDDDFEKRQARQYASFSNFASVILNTRKEWDDVHAAYKSNESPEVSKNRTLLRLYEAGVNSESVLIKKLVGDGVDLRQLKKDLGDIDI